MKNGLKEEVQCVFFFTMIKKNVFHSSVLTPSIDYPEFGHKKIGAARKKLDKNCCYFHEKISVFDFFSLIGKTIFAISCGI